MTLTEFKEGAEQIVEQYGINKHAVSVMCGYYGHFIGSNISYTVQVWYHEKRKHISSEPQKNPEAALEAFKDNLEHYLKQYDNTTKDLEL